MQNDIESIYSILNTERNIVFTMEIIPYLALFVRECQNFIGKDFLMDSINSKIADIRNHIKLYSERYGKTEIGYKKSIKRSDIGNSYLDYNFSDDRFDLDKNMYSKSNLEYNGQKKFR